MADRAADVQAAASRSDAWDTRSRRLISAVLLGAFTGIQLLSQVSSERVDLTQRLRVLWRTLLPGMVTPAVLSRITLVRPAEADRSPAVRT